MQELRVSVHERVYHSLVIIRFIFFKADNNCARVNHVIGLERVLLQESSKYFFLVLF